MTSSRPAQRIRETVRRYADEHGLLGPGPVVAAVSGGTDSTALALLLAQLADERGLVLHAAHFDHRMRRGGAAEAQFVSDLAARVGATIHLGRADRVPGSEDDAREARYAFLRRVAAGKNGAPIATGHTRDDQAETVLLHLVRGSGLGGLAGMRPERDGIVRPLLCVGRAETAAICAAAGVTPLDDATNRSLRHARNRIRRKVIPELEAIDPRARSAIARLADAAAEVSASHQQRALAALEGAARDGAIELDRLGDDRAVVKEALAVAWERATGHVLTARHREAVGEQALRRGGSDALDLPGGRLVRDHGRVWIERRAGA